MVDSPANLAGKTAIVTGAGRGIGRAIALRMAGLGANVVLISRSGGQLDEVRSAILSSGGTSLTITADVSEKRDVDRITESVRAQFGRIDILINNAGHVAVGTIAQLSHEDFERMLDVNIRAIYLCCRAAWDDLARNRGVIINLSSMSAFDPFAGLGAYGASKMFVNFYTRVLADEGAPLGIRAYAIAPGAVETDMLRGAFPDFPRDQALQPEDIADLAVKMLAPDCPYTSGEVVKIQR
jgi:fengycin family lipopeptide synthetase B